MKYRPTVRSFMLRKLVRRIEFDGFRAAIVTLWKHIVGSVRKHGLRGAFERFVRNAPIRTEDAKPQQPHPFDLLHGTDTGGYISGGIFSTISLSSIYSTAYLGATPSAFTQALSALPIQHQDFTFVDIGCGKGRALLIAAQFPFRHLLGVEISAEMCEIARANIAKVPDCAGRISIVNQDATTVTYPDGPLLLFLFNPFLAPVLRRVLQNLERQIRCSPRPAYILYEQYPRFERMDDSFAFLRELSETTYPFSSEDAAADPMERTQERFMLYCAEITR
jgi:SAM-dependent methyltransferase